MKIIADLHTHTNVSDHAYNTITEMARKAREMGMFAIGITNHGPSMEDSPHPWHFINMMKLPARIEDIWLLKGAEANVRDVDGTLDFSDAELKRIGFDWLIVSIHSGTVCRAALTEDEATRLWLNVAENPYVDCIGHSESSAYRYDYDAVTKAFAQKGKIVEMNGNSAVVRPGNEMNMRELALACMRNGTKIAVNSDAHSIYRVGQWDPILSMLEEIRFPEELVVNANEKNLIAALKERHKPIAELMEGSALT